MTTALHLDRRPERSVFPESIYMYIEGNPFFKFPLLKPPPQTARQCAKRFVESVYEAINEVHVTFNLAHRWETFALVLIMPLLQS